MYWGEGLIHVAVSDDLISWEPMRDEDGMLLVVLEPRKRGNSTASSLKQALLPL